MPGDSWGDFLWVLVLGFGFFVICLAVLQGGGS